MTFIIVSLSVYRNLAEAGERFSIPIVHPADLLKKAKP